MASDSSAESKAREVVVQAIASLQARGFDINAYSVAVEARVPRWFIAHNRDLMMLVSEARGSKDSHSDSNSNGTGDAGELAQKLQRLSREVDESNWENSVLRRYFQESQNDNQSLRKQLKQAQQEVALMQGQLQVMSGNLQVAWQQGFVAGQQAILSGSESGSESESESESESGSWSESPGQIREPAAGVAAASTAAGAPDAAAEDIAVTTAQPPASSSSPALGPDQIMAYVADVPLNIDDPEVLSDPFTAKLLNALQCDQSEMLSPAPNVDDQPICPTFKFDDPAPYEQQVDAVPGVSIPSGFHEQLDVDLPPLHEGDLLKSISDDITDRFTAEELHSLFQNRYVRSDDPPPEPQRTTTTEAPQQAKKFVGGKHAASADPVPAAPRVVPPDIRRACKLLGVNPDDIARNTVLEAWKHEMAKPGVHPDTGGDTEMAIYLNTAKDTLMRWVENQTPKLGKKFGQQSKTGEHPKQQRKQD